MPPSCSPARAGRLLPLVLVLLLGALGCGGVPPAGDAAEAPVEARHPVWADDAVIYEVFVPDFSQEGTFRGVLGRLDELQELGVNTLWFMPIHPIGVERRKGTLGSPYAIRDYYAVNSEYGTKEDFRALVDSIHARGLHVIIDFVANHTAWDHAWTEEHPDWYTRDEDGDIVVPEGTDWTDVADLDYDEPELRAEMRRVLQYWVREMDVDGFRCDVAEMVPLSFWEEAIDSLRAIEPVLMLAEGASPELHHAGFDLTYAWPAYGRMKEVWGGESVASLVELVREVEAGLPEGAARMHFTTNHDETAWDAPPPALFGGQQGAQAAFVLATTLPGVPLLYNGQETGAAEPVPFFERTPYDWEARPEVQAFYRRYLGLYNVSPALRGGTFEVPAPDAKDVFLARRAASGETLVVVVNVRDREATANVPEALAGRYIDVLDGTTVTLGQALTLAPYEYRILRESGGP